MRILRHILSHLFLILFLVTVVGMFYYRGMLFPAHVVERINGLVEKFYPPAVTFASKRDYFWSYRGKRIAVFDDLVPAKTTQSDKKELAAEKQSSKQAEKNTAEQLVQAKAVTDTQTVKEAQPVETEKAKEKVKTEEARAESDMQKPVETAKPEVKVKQQVEEPEKQASVVVKDSQSSSERELFITARKAFQKGDLKKAEKVYQQLVELDGDNPDTYGELGNIYYAQGKWDKAGQAYYEAAVRLVEEGNLQQVAYLQRVISGLNIEYAEKLQQKLQAH